jgi:hypothetical protein
MKTRQKKKVKRTRRRGGSRYFYPFNTKPVMFTNVSNKQQGGFIQNMLQRSGFNIQSSNDAANGYYPKTYQNPDPLVQPISSKYKI